MKTVDLYSDGACSGNPGPGGYAAILIYKGIEKIITGGEEQTTNNRMEMMGIIMGLRALKEMCKVYIYSDSAYCVNAINNKWVDGWRMNGWKNSSKKDVANKDLWLYMMEEISKHQVIFMKVKGHADNEYNNKCDRLAVAEVDRIKNYLV